MRSFNPDGNERLTSAVGVVLLVPIAIELITIPLGVHAFMSLHVFVGFVLIPLVLLKLASTGWRFARYYRRNPAYRAHGAPQLAMRILGPLFVTATIVLFASGVAMGFLHGSTLSLARRLHGPASVVWIALLGVHVLVYLKRALISSARDVARAKRDSIRGVKTRAYALVVTVVCGFAIAAATVPAQHRWVDLRHHRHHRQASVTASGSRKSLAAARAGSPGSRLAAQAG
jgi:hypothetical protein